MWLGTFMRMHALVSMMLCGAWAALSPKDKDACLASHNNLRKLHEETPDLVWDENLAKGAQGWADKLLQENGQSGHARLDFNIGQNVFMAEMTHGDWIAQPRSCPYVVLYWYQEISDYDFNTGYAKVNTASRRTWRPVVGHFTQLVWRNTKKVGMGMATGYRSNGRLQTFVVARYTPQGNYNFKSYENDGDSPEESRRRNWRANVRPRKAGAATPTLDQLVFGYVPPTAPPAPPAPPTAPPAPPAPPPTAPTAPPVCRDELTNCPYYQNVCFVPDVKRFCPKICNLC